MAIFQYPAAAAATPSNVPDLETLGTLNVAWDGITPATPPAGSVVQMNLSGQSAWAVWLSAPASGTSQVYFEGSQTGNNADWFALSARRNNIPALNETGTILDANPVLPAGVGTHWRGNDAGIKYLRMRLAVLGGTDSIAVTLRAATSVGAVFLNAAIPMGNNNIGSVSLYDSAEPITFTGTLATGSVSATYTPTTGKAVKLLWVQAIADPQASTNPVISLTIGGVEFYRGYAIAHRQAKTGAVNGPLVISIPGGSTTSVPFTVHLLEV